MKTSLGLLEVAGLALAIKVADIMAKSANIEIAGIERAKGSGWMLVSITGDVAAVKSAITSGAQMAQREKGWVADRIIARPASALDLWYGPEQPPQTPVSRPAPADSTVTDPSSTAATEPADQAAGAITASDTPADSTAADPSSTAATEPADQAAGAIPTSATPADSTAADPSSIAATEPADQAAGAITASATPADSTAADQPPPMAFAHVDRAVSATPAGDALPAKRSHHKAKPAASEVAVKASCNLCHDPACPRGKGEPRAACLHYNERGK